MYDIIVVGGGIAGLYTYNLSLLYPKKTIKIMEKSDILGGRVHTYKDRHFQVEAGAGRISSKNKLVLKLLDTLHLTDKLVPITNDFRNCRYKTTRSNTKIPFI